MSKKLVLSICSVILIIGVAVGLTYAYFTADTTAANVVTIGNVRITATKGTRIPQTITSGEPFDVDELYVKNVGTTDCYLRVRLVPEKTADERYYQSIEISDPRGDNLTRFVDDLNGEWFLYRNQLDSKNQVHFTATATLEKGAGDHLQEVQLRYEVEAIQAEHIESTVSGYPDWPNGTPILAYK